MSLVNDALKRAKEAQQKSTPPAPAPQLPPAKAAPAENRGMGMIMPLIIAVLVIVGFLFVWKNQHKAAAREAVTETKPAASVSPPPQTKPPVQSVAVSAPVTAAATVPPVVPVTVASPPVPPPKLQAIFFSPGRSTAIISGKTVRVGNTFRGYRVTAITESSATLVSATETNVMTLDQ